VRLHDHATECGKAPAEIVMSELVEANGLVKILEAVGTQFDQSDIGSKFVDHELSSGIG
jgi:hypothetical protein